MADTIGKRDIKYGLSSVLIRPHSENKKTPPAMLFLGATTLTTKNDVSFASSGRGKNMAAFPGMQAVELSVTAKSFPPESFGRLAGGLVDVVSANSGWSIGVQNMAGTTASTAGITLKSGATPKWGGQFSVHFAATGTPSLATATINALAFWSSDEEGNVAVTAEDMGIELSSENHYNANDKVSVNIYSPNVGGGSILYGGEKVGESEILIVREANSSRANDVQASNIYIPRAQPMGDVAMSLTPNEQSENAVSFTCLYEPTLQLPDGRKGGYFLENYSYPLSTSTA